MWFLFSHKLGKSTFRTEQNGGIIESTTICPYINIKLSPKWPFNESKCDRSNAFINFSSFYHLHWFKQNTQPMVLDLGLLICKPNVVFGSLKESTCPRTGVQWVVSNWSLQAPDLSTYIQCVFCISCYHKNNKNRKKTSRHSWTRDENRSLFECYNPSNPSGGGSMNRMWTLWIFWHPTSGLTLK